MTVGMTLIFIGYTLAYAAIKDENPWCEIVGAFGGTVPGGNCVGTSERTNDKLLVADMLANAQPASTNTPQPVTQIGGFPPNRTGTGTRSNRRRDAQYV